jgi:dTDP-4-dehydrorhamnose reductase
MRVAVIGARGQLGAAVVSEFQHAHDVLPYDRTSLDVTDGAAVSAAMRSARPHAVINCSGYNRVDDAERQQVEALSVNGIAVRSLARAALACDAALVHYSSDFVFDGTLARPLTETDAPNPRSAYASSKLLGEWFASESPRAYVLRVESLFGAAPNGPDKGSATAIVRGLRDGTRPKVFTDRTVSPTYIWDCARATRLLLEKRAAPGLYHCVNSGLCTWQEFALEAARLLGVEPVVEPVLFASAKFPAVRPQFCAMSNAKLAEAIAEPMPTWQNALKRYLEDLSRT